MANCIVLPKKPEPFARGEIRGFIGIDMRRQGTYASNALSMRQFHDPAVWVEQVNNEKLACCF